MSTNANIVIGVTGGIAAYKSAEIIRLLVKNNFNVKVIMTDNAKQFIHSNTLSALSHHPVYDQLFNPIHAPMLHIELAKWADLILIAPATASVIGKLSAGLADDLLTTVCLATEATIIVAPAMNKIMWENAFVQDNISRLKNHHIKIIDPESGEQACGDIGEGRMQEPEIIVDYILNFNNNNKILLGKTILITAGPTLEPIDPVRFISNHSSGKMGYALAQACIELGATVILISGPTALSKPAVQDFIQITTADEMYQAVMNNSARADILIAAAAVADYRPKNLSLNKIKKISQNYSLELVQTKDILLHIANLSKKPFTVGFALETDSLIENAKSKLNKKNLDIIIANQATATETPFNADISEVILISKKLGEIKISKDTKKNIAKKIMGLVCEAYFLQD